MMALLFAISQEVALPSGAVDVVERLGERVPPQISFINSDGEKVQLGRYLGKRPVVVAMVYYRCPVLCGLLLSGVVKGLSGVDWQLGQDYDVVSVSMDPSENAEIAAEKRRGFLQALGQPSSRAWPFLTGRADDIDTLSDAIGFRYAYVANQRQFAHVAALVVLAPDGKISRYLYGVQFPPQQLKSALFEAAAGKVGTSLERVLLRCYRYDPRTQRYELFVTRYFRAFGALMILAVSMLLGRLWWRERRT
jgi:protein SCO1/2